MNEVLWIMLALFGYGFFMNRKYLIDYCKQWIEDFKIIWNSKKKQ